MPSATKGRPCGSWLSDGLHRTGWPPVSPQPDFVQTPVSPGLLYSGFHRLSIGPSQVVEAYTTGCPNAHGQPVQTGHVHRLSIGTGCPSAKRQKAGRHRLATKTGLRAPVDNRSTFTGCSNPNEQPGITPTNQPTERRATMTTKNDDPIRDYLRAKGIRYITRIPTGPLIRGRCVVHNQVRPAHPLGMNGFGA